MFVKQIESPKVKLGDRITALQQIVSPFGKVNILKLFIYEICNKILCANLIAWYQTDTASVLLEAINYIRFLQEQVQVTPIAIGC